MTPDTLLAELRTRVQPAHHLPGRLRLRFAGGLPAGLSPDQLRNGLASLPGVRDLQINLLARSCTVTYDTLIIPPAAWDDLFAGQANPTAQALLDTLYRQLALHGKTGS